MGQTHTGAHAVLSILVRARAVSINKLQSPGIMRPARGKCTAGLMRGRGGWV
jgi:hypothetical protein